MALIMEVDRMGRVCVYGTSDIGEVKDLMEAVLSPTAVVEQRFTESTLILEYENRVYHIKPRVPYYNECAYQDPLPILRNWFNSDVITEKLEEPLIGFGILPRKQQQMEEVNERRMHSRKVKRNMGDIGSC